MYKDKDKQREANRERQRRYRANRGLKAYPKGVTNSGRDKQGVTDIERDKAIEFMAKTAGEAERAESKRGKFIDDQGNAHVPDQDFTKLMAQAGPGHVRVSKPGDSDYEPQCETTKAFIESTVVIKAESHVDASDISVVKAIHKNIHKRGKDIKSFEDY